MRIMMLSWEFPPLNVGGLAQHVYELSRSLVKAGCQVDVITSGEENLPARENVEGIGVWRVYPYHGGQERDFIDWMQRLNFALLEKGVQLIGNQKSYDLVHAHDWLVAYAARGLKHIYTMPLLATIHATEYGRNNGLHNAEQRSIGDLEWWLTYEAWKVVCCSRHMQAELQHVFQLPADKIEIIPNGIRPEAYAITASEPALEKIGFQPGEQMIFYVGRLVQEKGVQIVLEALPAISDRFPGTKFVVAGTGPHAENLKNRARELGLESRVHFLGYISDELRNELYNAAAVAVFPSLYEPFGIVALEAMATNTPVLVSAVGGLDEIVEHETDGLKAYPGDANSLAEQVCRLLGNKEWAEKLALKAYEKALNVYSWDKIAVQTADVYKEIISSAENKRWQEVASKKKHWGEPPGKKGEKEPEVSRR
ncbi:MAG: glycosyltransferase family 4 protein [Firmicutes bacterium]|nr:glycosyltransferase family 4 protein [Bacillota bacterium]